jgi:hypothetical protein
MSQEQFMEMDDNTFIVDDEGADFIAYLEDEVEKSIDQHLPTNEDLPF